MEEAFRSSAGTAGELDVKVAIHPVDAPRPSSTWCAISPPFKLCKGDHDRGVFGVGQEHGSDPRKDPDHRRLRAGLPQSARRRGLPCSRP